MRPPRYRFPDEVRSMTRKMAVRMVREGTVVQTPEELDAWIAQRPEVREPLERGGYGTHFAAHDLFPLLQAMIARAEASAPAPTSRTGLFDNRWLIAIVLVVVFVLLLLALLTTPRP